MLNLKKPNLSDMTFRRDFPEKLDYLASDGSAYIEIKCRAGGYLNPKLQKLNEQIELHRNVKSFEMVEFAKDRARYATASTELAEEIGRMRFEAFYDACVVEWSTNIENNGGPMVCDKEHFVALANVKIAEISNYFVDFARYVEDMTNFVSKADEETEKN